MSHNAGSLGDLQRAFQDYLAFQSAVRDTKRADRVTRFDVYRDSGGCDHRAAIELTSSRAQPGGR